MNSILPENVTWKLEWIINSNSGIKIFIPPLLIGERGSKKIGKIDIRNLPAIIFNNIRSFKSESYVEAQKEIIKIKPETHSGSHAQLFIQILKFKLGCVCTTIGPRIFKIPDITNISKKSHFKKYRIGEKWRNIKTVFSISFQLNIARSVIK